MKNNLSKSKALECNICTQVLNDCFNCNSMNNLEVMDYVAYYYGVECCYEWTHYYQNNHVNKLPMNSSQ